MKTNKINRLNNYKVETIIKNIVKRYPDLDLETETNYYYETNWAYGIGQYLTLKKTTTLKANINNDKEVEILEGTEEIDLSDGFYELMFDNFRDSEEYYYTHLDEDDENRMTEEELEEYLYSDELDELFNDWFDQEINDRLVSFYEETREFGNIIDRTIIKMTTNHYHEFYIDEIEKEYSYYYVKYTAEHLTERNTYIFFKELNEYLRTLERQTIEEDLYIIEPAAPDMVAA